MSTKHAPVSQSQMNHVGRTAEAIVHSTNTKKFVLKCNDTAEIWTKAADADWKDAVRVCARSAKDDARDIYNKMP